MSNNTPETFLAYNEAISTIQAINMQYEETTKSMCLVGVFIALVRIYNLKEVYTRVLEFMRENELYERYLSAILELQFNPPQEKKVEEQQQTDNKKSNKQQDGNGGIGTKTTDDNKHISNHFIRDLFKDDDNE